MTPVATAQRMCSRCAHHPAAPDCRLCLRCLEWTRQDRKRRHSANTSRCPRCLAKEPVPGRRLCAPCAEYARLKRARQVAQDPDGERARRRAYNQRIKSETLTAYGGCCACCCESNLAFLSIDHIDGGGARERQRLLREGRWLGQVGGSHLYGRLRREGFPAGYQVLCFNCNFAKSNHPGGCPHQLGT